MLASLGGYSYGLAPDTPEPEIVAHLFKLYADKMKWCGESAPAAPFGAFGRARPLDAPCRRAEGAPPPP